MKNFSTVRKSFMSFSNFFYFSFYAFYYFYCSKKSISEKA